MAKKTIAEVITNICARKKNVTLGTTNIGENLVFKFYQNIET